jgi:hypothetical protein
MVIMEVQVRVEQMVRQEPRGPQVHKETQGFLVYKDPKELKERDLDP